MTEYKFKKNKQYYLSDDDAKIKYVEQDREGYYVFKYIAQPELEEYSTKDGSEVWQNKKAYLESIKGDEDDKAMEGGTNEESNNGLS